MTQDDVRILVSVAAQGAFDAYWVASSPDVKSVLSGLVTDLNTLLTKLDQADLASRTDDFNAAAQLMKNSILPGVQKLNAAVEKVIQVEDAVNTALDDVLKLSMATSFFSIPAV